MPSLKSWKCTAWPRFRMTSFGIPKRYLFTSDGCVREGNVFATYCILYIITYYQMVMSMYPRHSNVMSYLPIQLIGLGVNVAIYSIHESMYVIPILRDMRLTIRGHTSPNRSSRQWLCRAPRRRCQSLPRTVQRPVRTLSESENTPKLWLV